MKRILPIFIALSGLFYSAILSAQTFTVTADTVTFPPFSGTATIHDDIRNITGGNLTIKWHVVSCNFPTDWLTPSAFGICDNALCRANSSNSLWNPSTSMGTSYTSIYVANATHDSLGAFSLAMDLAGATTAGTHYVTINLQDQGAGTYSKNVTFMLSKIPVSVPTTANSVSDIVLYPNPAHDELNVVYDASADIKTISVYNIIGKVMMVFRVSGTSANLNLESVPAGIYFVRLMNSQGSVVVTRKFTKQ